MFFSCFFQENYTIGVNIWHLSTLPIVRSNRHLSSANCYSDICHSSNCDKYWWHLRSRNLSRRDGSIHTETKNFPAQILFGFYYRHAGGKTVFKRVTLGIVWHSYTIYILYIFRILGIFRRSLQIQRLQILLKYKSHLFNSTHWE